MSCIFFGLTAYWNSVFQNAIGCAFGSLAAIIISIVIYKETVRESNEAVKNERLTSETNQLKAFKLMLQEVIRISNKMVEFIEEFIPALKTQPSKFPKVQVTSLGSLKRIIDTITVEKTGMTYMKYFVSEDSTKEFLDILKVVDYLYSEFGEFQEVVKRASLNHTARLVRVADILDLADKILLDNIGSANDVPAITQRINSIKENFSRNRGDLSDMSSVNNLYFVPMRDLMMNVLGNDMVNDFTKNFTHTVTKGIEYYNQVRSGYDQFISEVGGILSTVNENLPTLKTNAGKIINSSF